MKNIMAIKNTVVHSLITRSTISLFCILPVWSLNSVAQENNQTDQSDIEEIVIVGDNISYSEISTTGSMLAQQNPITSVLASIDNLPGVNVTEGDVFGFDDWSTTINLRGYQTSLSEQQIGITIDGFSNGDSNYGGGAKANRYIDSMNLGGVEVNQGIADIATRSHEALGGTLNFVTNDPAEQQGMRFQGTTGDYNSRRYYGRYDTGRILNGSTVAWLSVNHNEATDWMEGSAENERDHAAFKFIADLSTRSALTGYFSYDDTHEDNYQRITAAEFEQDSGWDRLLGDWTEVPYVNQLFRRGWSTLRKNRFAYLKLDTDINDSIFTNFGLYKHDMTGRGDWIPPQIVDVLPDNGGPEVEVLGSAPPVFGGSALGSIYFVDSAGNALSPTSGCTSSITFPYGGAGPESDPNCYPAGAIPVQSYRHTHYGRDRLGFTADVEISSQFGSMNNVFRGGLWIEQSTREESRDWHRLLDARIGIEFDARPYWVQYDREFERDTTNIYIQDTLSFGDLSVNVGFRQIDVDNSEKDNFGVAASESLSSDSDPLFSGGINYLLPVDGLEIFVGYSENVKPLLDLVLEREGTSTSNIEAETAENIEVGLRYSGPGLTASAVYFDNTFENRLEFFGPQTAGNIPNYTIGLAGRYDNVGGIETNGFELAAQYNLNKFWTVYGAYTNIDASYVGTGLGSAADTALGLQPGNTVVNTPEDMFVFTVDWTRSNYSAGLSTKTVGDRYLDRSNSQVAESYQVSDFYLKVRNQALSDTFKGYELSMVINNVFDESYLGGISGFGAWIGAPRTAVFGITADF